MRTFCALLLIAAAAFAQPAPIELVAQRSTAVNAPDATAVYPLDNGIVDVVLRSGVMTIAALAPGSTQIVVITRSGVQYIPVTVLPERPLPVFRRAALLQDSNGSYEIQYDSLSDRLQNIVAYRTQEGDRVMSVFLNDTVLRGPNVQTRHVIPAASFRIFTPARELVLLDDSVRSSPLTLEGTIVRGIHFRDGGLQFHAGYSSFSILDNLLFSRTRAAVAGVSYTHNLTDRSWLTPRLYVFPTRNSGRGTAGTVATLEYDYDAGTPLRLRAEGAVSRSLVAHRVLPGGYFELLSSQPSDSRSLRVEYQPDGFASLDTAVHGFRSDALWIRDLSSRWRSSFTASGNRVSIAGFRQSNALTEELLRFGVTPHWFVKSGGRYTYLDTAGFGAISTRELPVGFEYATPRAGAELMYTFIWSNGSDRGGNEISTSMHRQTDHFIGNLYALRRTQTPTLQFVFNEIPGLDLLLQQFGLTASTPQELLVLLREFPDLANAGLIRGINVNISPVHYQAGSLLSWRAGTEHDPRLDLSLHYTRDELVAHTREAAIATLGYVQKVSANVEVGTQLSRFFSRDDRGGWKQLSGWSVTLRHRFSELPTPSNIFARRGEISGIVFADPEGTGDYTPSSPGLAGVDVWLDEKTKTTTSRDGRFSFTGVRDGSHQIEARYASTKPFRYTTPPAIDADIDHPVAFGIGTIAAHLTATVLTTEGTPVDHVRILVHDGARMLMHETVEGKSSIDFPRAEVVQVAVNADSLPPGYVIVDGGPKSVRLQEAQPATVSFVVKRLRSISGRLTTNAIGVRGARVTLDRSAASVTDDEGAYVFRNVARGPHSVQAVNQTRKIVVPDEPTALHDVNFEVPLPLAGEGAAKRRVRAASSFALQTGAFRQQSNADKAMRDAEAAGFRAYLVHAHDLGIVRVGPFATRPEAEAAQRKLGGFVVQENP